MFTSPELARALQNERDRALRDRHLALLAGCVRRCCTAPVNLLDRIVRSLRPLPAAC